MTLKSFRFYRNYAGDQTSAVPRGHVDNYLLTAGVAKTITIPTGARYVMFTSSADLWVVIGSGIAAIPTGDVTDGSGSELNPICRWIEGETQMSIISGAAAKVSIMYYD
jgi:hypothetical protein